MKLEKSEVGQMKGKRERAMMRRREGERDKDRRGDWIRRGGGCEGRNQAGEMDNGE